MTRSPRGRKPRVLWVNWSYQSGGPLWSGVSESQARHNHDVILEGRYELVKFVEAPRRKRSPRGRKEKKP